MSAAHGRHAFVRMFSSAVVSQALLSAASLFVGLALIRRTADLQYGAYILVSGGIILLTSLQNSFIGPAMVHRLTHLNAVERGDLIGGLFREQRRLVSVVAVGVALLLISLAAARVIDRSTLLLTLSAVAAVTAALRREYFRMVLLAYRRSHEVLLGDALYAAMLVAGVLLAILTAQAAMTAVLSLGFAAWVAGSVLQRSLLRNEAWNLQGAPGILRRIAPLASWSTGGAAVHWSFSQGYNYLVVGLLDLPTVAAIAATRLLMMPVNLLSTGIGGLMLPLTSGWLHQHGAALVLRRLLGFAFGIGVAALCYFALLWLARDWIFDHVLQKHFAQRDELLLLWGATFMMMVFRDQLIWLPIARERFRLLTPLAACSALLSLMVSYWALHRYGAAGAPMGVLTGESINLAGILILSLREMRPVDAGQAHSAGAV